MSGPSRLVILGSSVTALAVARNAADLGMRPVIVDTEAGVATATRRAEVRLIHDASPESILGCLLDLAREHAGAWLIATSDAWLRFLGVHRTPLERAFDWIVHPSNAVLDICLRKAAFSHWCAQAALPTPRHFDEARALADAESLPYPLLLRPVESEHGHAQVPKAMEVHDPAELTRGIAMFRAVARTAFVTESLLGRRITQYSVGAARRGEALTAFVAIKRRPLPAACAVGTFVELAPDDRVERLARDALVALDYQGIAEVEILRDEERGRDYLIEINARPWVQYALGAASGHDLLAFLVDPANVSAPRRMRSGRRWINLSTDLYGCYSRSLGVVRNGSLPFGVWLVSVLRANTFAHFSWRDPAPAWRDFARLVVDLRRARH